MTWVKLDDSFPEHPKLAALDYWAPLAGWLYICGLAYCNRLQTDGEIPKGALYRLVDFRGYDNGEEIGDDITPEEIAAMLIRVGLWEEVEGIGYRVHDYFDYQPSKAQLDMERSKKVAAGRAGGMATAQARAVAGATSSAAANGRQAPQQTVQQNRSSGGTTPVPVPSRPDNPLPVADTPPVVPLEGDGEKRRKPKRVFGERTKGAHATHAERINAEWEQQERDLAKTARSTLLAGEPDDA